MSNSPPAHTFLQAALEILQSVNRPLTTREIADEALRRGLLSTTGRTPDASMSAALYSELGRAPNGLLQKVSEPGSTRARRGSVRWMVTPAPNPPSGEQDR